MEYTDIELKNEQWIDIDGYDGAYQVSDLGRVRSHKSGEWKVIRQRKTSDLSNKLKLAYETKPSRIFFYFK